MADVVLRGPAKTAPDTIIGPFETMGEADAWATEHQRPGDYCVAQDLTSSDDALDVPD
jgi:hypothetical protein